MRPDNLNFGIPPSIFTNFVGSCLSKRCCFRSRCVSIFSGCYLLAHVRKESYMLEMLRTKKGGLQHPELQPLNCQIAMFTSLALCGSVWTLGDRNIDGEFAVDGKVLCFFPCQIVLFLFLISMVFSNKNAVVDHET